MKKNKELLKNTIILMFGKLCTQFISFLLIPVYTLKLSTSEFGIVDLITTYIALLVPVITIQLEMAIFRFLIEARQNNQEKKEIITNSYITIAILFIIFIPIYFIFSNLFNIKYSGYIILMIIVTALTNISLQTARGLGDNVGYSIGSLISAILNISFTIFFLVFLNFKIEGIFISQIVSNFISLCFLFIREHIFKYFSYKEKNRDLLFKLIKYSLPLVPNGVIWWIINASDRTILTLFISSGANGIYAISNKFSNIVISIFNIYNLSWTESLAIHIDEKDNFVNNTINSTIIFFASICLCLIAYMPIIFRILINNSFNEAYYYIPILIVSTIFNIIATILGAVYIAKKETGKIALTSVLAGLINIIINILLVKKIKIYASAISTLVAFIIISVYRYIDIKKYICIKLNVSKIMVLTIEAIIIIFIYYSKNILLISLGCIISPLLLVMMNNNLIKPVVKKLI